jgi:hypothetical protein
MTAAPKQPEQADGVTDLPSVDLSAIVTVSKAPNKGSQSWEKVETSLGELLTNLKKLEVGKKGDDNVWAPATFKFSRRKAEYALETHLLVLDSDAGHTLPVLRSRVEALGWYAVIIPSPSWGSDVSEISGDAYDRWAAEVRKAEGEDASVDIERFLIEKNHKTPAIAKGASVLLRVDQTVIRKDGGKYTATL